MDIPAMLADRLKVGAFTRIVAFGSSNTERRIPGMHWFDCFELACRSTYGPHTACINSGRGGDTTLDLLERFDRDCLGYRPELVFLTVGGNDSNPARAVPVDSYRANLKRMIDAIHAIGGRTVLQTYYAIDAANIDPGHAPVFVEMMEVVRGLSRETGSMLIDHFARWERLRHCAYPAYKRLMLDALHVNEPGNLLLGADIARAFALKLPDDPYFREALAMQVLLDQLSERTS